MRSRRLIFILITTLLTLGDKSIVAQDIHFSQFNASPILLNPAFAGVNSCSYRFASSYRMQWTGVADYRTLGASIDFSIGNKRLKSSYGGVGLSFFNDKAGDSQLSTNQVNLSLSYTISLNSKGTQTLSSAITGGFGQRSINLNELTFDSQFGDGGYNPQAPSYENLNNDNKTYGDIGAGFLWSLTSGKYSNYYAGLAITHMNQPNISFLGGVDDKLYMKFTFHGGGQIPINKQWFLMPTFLFLKQGPHNQLNIGSLVKIRKSIIPSEKTAFYFGSQYRFKDAIIPMVRVDISGFNIGFSYDVTLSKATVASNGNGGPELSLQYTGCFAKKKKKVTYCPVL